MKSRRRYRRHCWCCADEYKSEWRDRPCSAVATSREAGQASTGNGVWDGSGPERTGGHRPTKWRWASFSFALSLTSFLALLLAKHFGSVRPFGLFRNPEVAVCALLEAGPGCGILRGSGFERTFACLLPKMF